jgi:hypothetical protein
VPNVTSGAFDISSRRVAVQFLAQPTNVVVGAAIAPAVQVRLVNAQGSTVTTATNSVTIALGANPGEGTLGGTLTVAAVNGVATFSNPPSAARPTATRRKPARRISRQPRSTARST